MKEKFNLYKINKKTVYKVIIFHIIFILFLAVHLRSFRQNKKTNLIVNNVIETPKPKKIIEKKAPIKKMIKPKTSLSPKKITNPTQKPSTKASSYENLIDKLEKQIQTLDKPQKTITSKKELLIPKTIKTLNIDKIIENETTPSKLKELLIKELKATLNLPEYGTVKVSFTICPNGEITDVVILEHQSYENQKYLKNSLSELSFESINKMFDEPQKFIVIFKNE